MNHPSMKTSVRTSKYIPFVSLVAVLRPCQETYPHLKTIEDKLYLSGGTVDLLIGTDFVDAFVDIHTNSGNPGEPVAKRNCFGWYVLGQLDSDAEAIPRVHSVDIKTVSAAEDIRKRIYEDFLGVRPTELCTCSENALHENKLVKALSASTTLVSGRVQVKMAWKETGPPKQSNYDIALKRMYSAEKSFKKKDCLAIVDEEVQKLVDQSFVIKGLPENVDHSQQEWYMPLQAVFIPEKSTKVRLVFDSSSKGHNGLSLNDHLEKGPNYINSRPNVLSAWRWDEFAYAGDILKMFNQVLVHPDDEVFLTLTRIYNTCQEALAFVNFHECDRTFWTDSRTVLTWIKTQPREFRPFVSVRVAEIQETVGSEQFRYIKSKYNPADALTRGIAPGTSKVGSRGRRF